jgi:hypothetical protein
VAAGIIALLAAATSAVWAWKLMDLAPPGAAGSPTAAGWAAAAALLSPLPGSLLILPGQPDRGKHLLRMMAACWAWAGAASLAGALIALAAASVLGAIPHAEPSTMVMESER